MQFLDREANAPEATDQKVKLLGLIVRDGRQLVVRRLWFRQVQATLAVGDLQFPYITVVVLPRHDHGTSIWHKPWSLWLESRTPNPPESTNKVYSTRYASSEAIVMGYVAYIFIRHFGCEVIIEALFNGPLQDPVYGPREAIRDSPSSIIEFSWKLDKCQACSTTLGDFPRPGRPGLPVCGVDQGH